MQLTLAIDGRLVAHAPTAATGHLYVFHEYARWSLLTVAAATDTYDEATDGGTASVTLQQPASLDELAKLVDARCGPGTWSNLLTPDDLIDDVAT